MIDMHPELRDQLYERLAHRAERLGKVARLGAPVNIVAFMTEHVISTAILLCGDHAAQMMLCKVIKSLREREGICSLCGERPLVEKTKVCVVCEAEMIAMDAELDETSENL